MVDSKIDSTRFLFLHFFNINQDSKNIITFLVIIFENSIHTDFIA